MIDVSRKMEVKTFTGSSVKEGIQRETPSIVGIINLSFEGFRKLLFGHEEIVNSACSTIEATCATQLTTDVFINSASFRSVVASSIAANHQSCAYYCWRYP